MLPHLAVGPGGVVWAGGLRLDPVVEQESGPLAVRLFAAFFGALLLSAGVLTVWKSVPDHKIAVAVGLFMGLPALPAIALALLRALASVFAWH